MQQIDGRWTCSQCNGADQDGEIVQRTPPTDSTVVAQQVDRDPVTPEFLLCLHPSLQKDGDEHQIEPCNRNLITTMRKGDIPNFVCPVCNDSRPYPGMQSLAVTAAASIPVIGPIAAATVAAVEGAVLRKRRR